MAEPRLYAAPPFRWRRHVYATIIAPSPLVRYALERGVRGDEVRWWLSPDRPESVRRQVMGTERVGGPWPFGFKFTRGYTFRFIYVDPVSQVLGWALTLYAVVSIIRRRKP